MSLLRNVYNPAPVRCRQISPQYNVLISSHSTMSEGKVKKITDVQRGFLQRIMAEKLVAATDVKRVLDECKEAFAPVGEGAKADETTVYSTLRDINDHLEVLGFAIEKLSYEVDGTVYYGFRNTLRDDIAEKFGARLKPWEYAALKITIAIIIDSADGGMRVDNFLKLKSFLSRAKYPSATLRELCDMDLTSEESDEEEEGEKDAGGNEEDGDDESENDGSKDNERKGKGKSKAAKKAKISKPVFHVNYSQMEELLEKLVEARWLRFTGSAKRRFVLGPRTYLDMKEEFEACGVAKCQICREIVIYGKVEGDGMYVYHSGCHAKAFSANGKRKRVTASGSSSSSASSSSSSFSSSASSSSRKKKVRPSRR